MQTTLFNTIMDFWLYWLGPTLENTETLYLVTLATTLAFAWALIVKPVCWCFGIRRKRKND